MQSLTCLLMLWLLGACAGPAAQVGDDHQDASASRVVHVQVDGMQKAKGGAV